MFKLLLITGLFFSLNAKVIGIQELIQSATKQVKSINTKELQEILKQNPNIQFIDVRSKKQILDDGAYIKVNNLTFLPRDKLEFLVSEYLKPNEKAIIYCNKGGVSLLATKKLLEMGYKNVLYYEDSLEGWRENNLPSGSLDKYLDSPLYSKIEKIADGVYTSIGITAPYLYESNAHNNNLGFVTGDKSVLVWNGGSSYMLAKALHEEIKKITNKPIKYVVLENSQGHAILGSSYWKEQGATIVAHEIVIKEIQTKGKHILNRMKKVLKDKFVGTKLITPDVTFKKSMKFDLGGRVVEAKYFGFAHEHSDILLWLEKEKILFAGDIAFNNRLLPIFKITETKKWLKALEDLAALNPKIVVPGHGNTTDLKTVLKYTKGYLEHLRTNISEILDRDEDVADAQNMDLSNYKHLDTFKELSRQNIARLFEQMEFEE